MAKTSAASGEGGVKAKREEKMHREMDRKGPRSGGHRTTRSHSGAEKSDGWLSILLGFSFPLASVKPLKGINYVLYGQLKVKLQSCTAPGSLPLPLPLGSSSGFWLFPSVPGRGHMPSGPYDRIHLPCPAVRSPVSI
ncbi:uncharacterized protein MCYG_07014 [Microsporum canis CBS 113480]|uniref:Uncharacterized protein n=1 Tax=Arthroderma otae (strain ATCC MYA-4605 / CBS 113480) TaxID=554155 RepID=C5FWB1_ARTOC|nr:uncharacterized protein MCYG_07014 [Microsporum canis CBS 113480]EEQ34195.1 predicted protein [Microsporum canis CBS 113480]